MAISIGFALNASSRREVIPQTLIAQYQDAHSLTLENEHANVSVSLRQTGLMALGLTEYEDGRRTLNQLNLHPRASEDMRMDTTKRKESQRRFPKKCDKYFSGLRQCLS